MTIISHELTGKFNNAMSPTINVTTCRRLYRWSFVWAVWTMHHSNRLLSAPDGHYRWMRWRWRAPFKMTIDVSIEWYSLLASPPRDANLATSLLIILLHVVGIICSFVYKTRHIITFFFAFITNSGFHVDISHMGHRACRGMYIRCNRHCKTSLVFK